MSTICHDCYSSAVRFGNPPAVDEEQDSYYTTSAPSCCTANPFHPAHSMYLVYDLV